MSAVFRRRAAEAVKRPTTSSTERRSSLSRLSFRRLCALLCFSLKSSPRVLHLYRPTPLPQLTLVTVQIPELRTRTIFPSPPLGASHLRVTVRLTSSCLPRTITSSTMSSPQQATSPDLHQIATTSTAPLVAGQPQAHEGMQSSSSHLPQQRQQQQHEATEQGGRGRAWSSGLMQFGDGGFPWKNLFW